MRVCRSADPETPLFQRTVDVSVATGVESYGYLNGGDVVASKELLKDQLCHTMGFNGMMTTTLEK
ncbi:hypothetical protein BB558_003392 [Smittium angustum]|uniref:Uncharacterized protein n=1 Tax=Smittium angustum TaxID=133377 RepID=A0A2U1J6B7_SMIAN|nr:hypothetical protein BB558_003392 [Smittium angustum]